jgi:single-stranded DNA-binding protein
LKLDTWEKDGRKQSKLKVVADRLQLLTAPARRAEPVGAAAGHAGPSYIDDDRAQDLDSSDIPF